MRVADHVGDTVCGYRLVRLIQRGRRQTVYLGRAGTDVNDAATMAVKIFTGPDSDADAESEIIFGARVSSPFLPAVHDVGVTRDGSPVIISERLGERVSTLLGDSVQLAAGAVVTLIAPVATALRVLHAEGITHGDVSTSRVRVTPDGRPVLMCGRRTMSHDVAGFRSAVAADLRDYARFVDAVLDHTDPQTAGRGRASIVDWLTSTDSDDATSPGSNLFDELECRVFELARPLPFTLGSVSTHTDREIPSRAVMGDSPGKEEVYRSGRMRRIASLVPDPLADFLSGELGESPASRLRDLHAGVARWISPTRRLRPLLVACAVFTLAIAGALTLLPATSDASDHPTTSGEMSSGATRSPMSQSTVKATPPASSGSETDPVQALRSLLTKRAGCFARGDVGCLDSVYQDGSPAAAADRAALTDGAGDPNALLSLPVIELAFSQPQPQGDAVIVVVSAPKRPETAPVPVLIMRTGTGWVIRDVFES